ncbi:efflux RND transporter periplasmic adaptor subunit [Silvanigrella paludirubra]|uniref:Efflux RND transporter periplasmic adaptor subunit n=1 Tax=Silvanigrella paludirubra TaxID=2499159 RepID=A0A6N6VP30_9BACT|nr:efflux RND transporter periplasmic adaptor subunit [Silvanigrella paludirubra]KAB8036784.1 efflux RND transporter periplasmic adaptor subunit [Silvanigrella paludirubra]
MKYKIIIISLFIGLILFQACKRKEVAELPPEINFNKKQELKINEQNEQNLKQINPAEKKHIINLNNEVILNQLPATVYGTNTSQLSFRVNGFIYSILAKNGQYVKKGQVIAKLDNSIFSEQLKLAQYNLEQAKNSEKFALLSLKRTQTLNQKQATTQIALEQAESNYLNSQIAVKLADTQLKIAQINFNDTSLIAPFSGYIFNLTSWIGNYVSATSPIVTLASLENLQIQLLIPQTIENNFKVGQKFPFKSTNQKNKGIFTITNIIPYIDQNNKSYLIIGVPSNTEKQLMSGELILIQLK